MVNQTSNSLRISATFLDEISHDIPHQNWGKQEWDRDFKAMKAVGIDTVVLIRCGWRRWMTYPSKILLENRNGFKPPVDLVRMFLDLSEKHGMSFFFGIYDSGEYWHAGQYRRELDLNKALAEEVWKLYGDSPAFKGWYLSWEVSRNSGGLTGLFSEMGNHVKNISAGLPVMISPYIEGRKTGQSAEGITLAEHESQWNEIMAGVAGAVDIVAFQDGHVDFHELGDFLGVNSALAAKHGLRCWTNTETFDRDMPIRFPPIKWEKLLLKLEAAQRAGVERAITFEFSHFMSPHSCYPQAHGLFKRYCEHFGIEPHLTS